MNLQKLYYNSWFFVIILQQIYEIYRNIKLKIDNHFHANRVLEINQATYVKSLQIAAIHFEGLHYPDIFNVLFVIFECALIKRKSKIFTFDV